MKKIIISILLLLVILINLTSCVFSNNPFYSKDYSGYMASRLENLLDELEEKDFDELKLLFTESTRQTEDFDVWLQMLIDYYNGESYNYYDHGAIHSSNDNNEKTTFTISYDIYTTEEVYRLYIKDIVYNVVDPKEVGIESLYIIKFKNDTTPEKRYVGDGKKTPGIHIAKTREN